MNKYLNNITQFIGDIYDYFFYSASLQERRFKSDYDLLRLKFIAKHHSYLEDATANVLTFKSDLPKEVSGYSELCRNVINLLHPDNRNGKRLDTDSKFKLLNVARREQILEYTPYECDTRIQQILVETTKLDAWRKDAILQLLNKYKDIATDQKSSETVKASLYEAAYIRDVHFDNAYYKSKLAKRTIGFLNRVLVSLLLTILIYSAFLEYGLLQSAKPFLLGPFSDLWLVVLFGLLGAAFSTLLNLYKGDKLKNTIIKQIDSINLTLARLVIGASAGVIVFLILNSNLITITGFNDSTPSPGNTTKPLTLAMLSLVFIAGFTERLVLNFIDKLSAQAQKSNDSLKEQELKIISNFSTSTKPPGNGTNGKTNGGPDNGVSVKPNEEVTDESEEEAKSTTSKGSE